MSRPVGDQNQVPRLQQLRSFVAGVEPHRTRRDHVRPEVLRQWRQRQAPGGGELRAAVEGAAHPQEMERLTKWVVAGWGVGQVHGASMPDQGSTVQQDWTSEHELGYSSHRQSPYSRADWTKGNARSKRSDHDQA